MDESKFNEKMIENELKNKFCRCIQSHNIAKYIYRNIIINVVNDIIYLHYNNIKNYSRNIRNVYTLNIEDNSFTHEQLLVIFSNLDYIIEVIKKRLLNIFSDEEYENIENGFEFKYSKSNKSFEISIEYQLINQISINYKNEIVSEIIIGTLLDASNELNDNSNNSSLLVIDGGDIKYMGQII